MTLELRIRSLPLLRRLADRAARVLERTWVRLLLFVAVFLAAWLLGSPTAHALA